MEYGKIYKNVTSKESTRADWLEISWQNLNCKQYRTWPHLLLYFLFGGWKTLMKNLMSTLYDAWPVVITALLFSWLSGMIIWLLVCSLN